MKHFHIKSVSLLAFAVVAAIALCTLPLGALALEGATATTPTMASGTGSASGEAGPCSSSTGAPQAPVATAKGKPTNVLPGSGSMYMQTGNSTSDDDFLRFRYAKATVKSMSRIIDLDHHAASYVKGAGTSTASWEFKIEAQDPDSKVKLHLTNPWRFEAEWDGEGLMLRQTRNKGVIYDVNGDRHTFDVSLSFKEAEQKTTGWTFTGSIGGKAGKDGEKKTLSFEALVGATYSNITQSGGDTVWGGIAEVLGKAAFSKEGTGGVEHTAKLTSYIKQSLKAQGKDKESLAARVTFDTFDALQELRWNYAIEVGTGNGSPLWEWDASGEPLPMGPDVTGPSPTITGRRLALVVHPVGLQGETGAHGGVLAVLGEGDFVESVAYDIETDPSTSTTLPASVTVPAGSSAQEIEFDALSAGTITVTATKLDEYGQPTTETDSITFDVASLAAMAAPLFEVSVGATDMVRGEDEWSFLGMKGQSSLDLDVYRSGFDSFATQSTTLTVSVDDPSGILATLPSGVVIPAGEHGATLAIDLLAVSGDASVQLLDGSEVVAQVAISSVGKYFSFVPSNVSLPANAIACVHVLMSHADYENALTYQLTVQNGSLLQVESLSATQAFEFPAGSDRSAFRLSGAGTAGPTTITAWASGIPSEELSVTLRDPEVEVTRTQIDLSDMAGSDEGAIHLTFPEGTTVSAASGPSGSSGYMTISGINSSELLLEFLDGQPRPASIAVTITLSNPPPAQEAFQVVVEDLLRCLAVGSTYAVEVP